eukprot:CAMPEP_0198698196 /NCGR_PEP_ID=MMETSP1468-20131203/333534_1 /TAXON_ID=1461545 /ORGANISM="Mantoniella sp, Strain CCMP1436" /LENGTH=330 /DNA_ID=CAMNT_0044455121 /DNA_START=39 /DNA_END=1027 /DNA_ORIENTATION=+
MAPPRRKIIIDTDPGVDDSWAILLALRSPEVEVVGLTTLFGNVRTTMATQNALYLLEVFGRADIPVVEGSLTTLTGGAKERIADFVHGDDGLGNTNQPPPVGKAVHGQTAAEFIVAKANEFPGEITVVALASATNVTLALRLDPALRTLLAGVVHLGGAFFVNGNVNPAAEANIFGDPEAADELYRSGAAVTVIGLDVTQRLMLMKADLEAMRAAAHPHTRLLYDISQFYMDFHVNTVATAGIYMHDPAAVLLAFRPDLFTCRRGRVRVATEEGVCRGQTVLDQGGKLWSFENAWTAAARPEVAVALDVDIAGVMRVFRERFDIKGGAKG